MTRICQKELARTLGVSQAAVSGVINGTPSIRVGKETRQKILNAIKEANYQPNRLANAFRGRDTKTIGVIYQGGFVPLGMRKLSAVVRSICRHGYMPLVYDLLLDLKGEEQCRLLCDLQVNGVILINASEPFMYDVYPEHLKGKMNVASIDSPWDPSVRQFYADRYQGFRILTEHLIAKGHRKIATLSIRAQPQTVDSPYTHSYGHLRGVGDALKKAKLKPVASVVYNSDSKKNSSVDAWEDTFLPGKILMAQLLDKGCRPDAVICSSDSWAIGAIKECLERGIRVPEEIAIVGFNDDTQAKYATCSLTTVLPPTEELVEAAVRHLIETPRDAKHFAKDYAPVILPCELVVRDSCGANIASPCGVNASDSQNPLIPPALPPPPIP